MALARGREVAAVELCTEVSNLLNAVSTDCVRVSLKSGSDIDEGRNDCMFVLKTGVPHRTAVCKEDGGEVEK